MNDPKISAEFATEAVKGSWPVAVATSSLVGMIDWQTWVLILTAFYVVMQIFWLGWRFVDKFRGKPSAD